MSTEFLQALASSSLPKQISDVADIDLLRLLVAAGMIEADLPGVDEGGVATVHRVTGYGRASLTAHASGFTPRRP